MRRFWSGSHHALLGVDIEFSSVRLLAFSQPSGFSLKAKARPRRIEALAIEAIPENIAPDDYTDAVGAVIQTAVQSARTNIKQAALAVSGPAVFTQQLSVPGNLSEADIQAHIAQAATRLAPYPLAQAAVDFAWLGDATDSPDGAQLTLAVCWLPFLEKRIAALQVAGLETVVVDVAYLALRRTFIWLAKQMPSRSTTVVFYLGEHEALFLVLANQKLATMDVKPLITEPLPSETDDQAWPETAAPSFAGDMEKAPRQASQIMDDELIPWLLERLGQLSAGGAHTRAECLLLAGRAGSPSWQSSLQAHLAITVRVICMPPLLPIAETVDAHLLANRSAELMVACGLALHGGYGRH